MKTRIHCQQIGIFMGMALLAGGWMAPASASAASQGSLLSVTEESQIQPIRDDSGKYLLKSDGFYCLNENGNRENTPGVHYFDHTVIDGTVLNGYYYHDESGKFKSGSPHMVYIRQVTCNEKVFDGYYMANNLGKLSAAPQIRYMDNLVLNNVTFNGYYYFNENGRMVTEPGCHYIQMTSNGQAFDGTYYFGGANGVLVQEAGITPEGFPTDESGRLENSEDIGMDTLKPRLETMLSDYEGEWSIYVKDLESEEEFVINDKALYSASLIKPFVMVKTYENMDTVLENEAKLMNTTADNAAVKVKVDDLLENMITVSDNESCNELARLQSSNHDFLDGAKQVNAFIKKEGYSDTTLQSTLHPSSSPAISLGGHNMTGVRDCGKLLEAIYRGECVSEEASAEMLDLLLNQQATWKIPAGLKEGIRTASKTGETDIDQHDIAIVYGEGTTYILCVMSEGCPNGNTAIEYIRDISKVTYNYLNLFESVDLPEDPEEKTD